MIFIMSLFARTFACDAELGKRGIILVNPGVLSDANFYVADFLHVAWGDWVIGTAGR